MIFNLFILRHTYTTKIPQQSKKYKFCQSAKKIGVVLTHSHQTAIVVLVVIFLKFDNLRKKRSVPLLNSQVLPVLKILVAQQLKITALDKSKQNDHPYFVE